VDQKDAGALKQRIGSFTWNTTQEDGSVCRPFDGTAVEGVDVLDSPWINRRPVVLVNNPFIGMDFDF
jgi:hypothetical protein